MRHLSNAEMGFSYRHCGVADDVIFTSALFQGRAGDPASIAAEMAEIKASARRAAAQSHRRLHLQEPARPQAWKLVDEAGCRGLQIGQAQVSELHCNFLINLGGASAADIETLGETVRARVKANSGVELEWEIKRIGVASTGDGMALNRWFMLALLFLSAPLGLTSSRSAR